MVVMTDRRIPRGLELDPRAGIALGGLAAFVLAVALVPLRGDVSPAALALLLVLPVLLGATTGGRLGGAATAIVATLSFDFFLTRPYLSLTIDSQDDVETAVLLLVVALVVGTVAAGARRSSYRAERGRRELDALHRVAHIASGGGGDAETIEAARRELIRVLDLDGCEFDRTTGRSPLPELAHSGAIEGARLQYVHGGFTLPSGIELPVRHRGRPLGRFVLHGRPNVPVAIDARLAAVVIASHVGAALDAGDRDLGGSGRKEQS
jgi:hypothetical protein